MMEIDGRMCELSAAETILKHACLHLRPASRKDVGDIDACLIMVDLRCDVQDDYCRLRYPYAYDFRSLETSR